MIYRTLAPLLIFLTISSCASTDKKYSARDIDRILKSGDELKISEVLETYGVIRVAPEYPRQLARQGIHGWSVVEFSIGEDGRTKDIRVVDGQPKGVFDQTSIAAIRQWRYKPHVENGQVIEVKGVSTKFSF
ncbi:energy transducer TonB [Aurantivibrio infirmus]